MAGRGGLGLRAALGRADRAAAPGRAEGEHEPDAGEAHVRALDTDPNLAPEVGSAAVARQADDLITVRQLRGRGAETSAIDFEDDEIDLSKAVGAVKQEDFSSRLKRVTQLTGLSDPVYAEAYVTVHAYDILLEVLLINQTSEPMHHLCLELAVVARNLPERQCVSKLLRRRAHRP